MDTLIVIEVERVVGLSRLWEHVLDHGPKCIDVLRNLVRVDTFPSHALSACPLCVKENVSEIKLVRLFDWCLNS